MAIFGLSATTYSAKEPILVLQINGIINPVVGDYVEEAMAEAAKLNSPAVLIQLNTPGGLLEATRTAISAMINSDIPVIVYISPRGARGTSAGVFITMASDIAAMAPDTHIGAAHPVTITGESPRDEKQRDPQPEKESTPKKIGTKTQSAKDSPEKSGSVMEEKMVSDSAAYIRTLASERGRNAEWAERAVRESVSLTSGEALKNNVIEIIAESKEDLIRQIDGREITKNKKTITLNLKDVPFKEYPMSSIQKFLHLLAHPNVAYILMMLGFYGLIYEFSSPGVGLGGVIGGICLLLAFYSLQVLPINAVGLVLILFGIGCLVLELLTPTQGILTLGGLIAFAIGSFMLIDVPRDISIPRVSIGLILPTVLTTGLFFTLVLRSVMLARKRRPLIGSESLVGMVGEVKETINPNGMLFLNGELWMATSDEPLEAGDHAAVVAHQGNQLKVKKIN